MAATVARCENDRPKLSCVAGRAEQAIDNLIKPCDMSCIACQTMQALTTNCSGFLQNVLGFIYLARNIGTATSIRVIDDHDLAMRILEFLVGYARLFACC